MFECEPTHKHRNVIRWSGIGKCACVNCAAFCAFAERGCTVTHSETPMKLTQAHEKKSEFLICEFTRIHRDFCSAFFSLRRTARANRVKTQFH